VRDRSEITIAIVGGNTVAGLALSFLLRSAGYDTIVLKAPPPGDLLRDVDLLLVSPDLDGERRKGSLATLKDTEEGPRIPVLTFSATVEENVFAGEAAGSSWPVEIGGLARAIETTLRGEAEIGPAFVANPVGEAALP
jgi:hypothetical protein